MKKVLLLLLFFTSACEKSHRDVSDNYSLPPELKDCKVFHLQSDSLNYLYVVRCPNSTTNTNFNCGKGCNRDVQTSEECP